MVSFRRSLVLWITLLATIHFKCSRSSSSGLSCSSKDKMGEIQECRSRAPDTYSRDGFYCPFDRGCKPATERCLNPPSQVCKYGDGGEQGCGYSSSTGRYDYYLGRTPLFSSLGRRKRSCTDYQWEHQFVDYRGFTYEFGCYLVQVLDKNSPKYKYRSGGETVDSRDLSGSSDCTYQELKYYVKLYWSDREYELCSTNCQDFARGLIKLLKSNCQVIRAYTQQGSRKKRSLPDSLVQYFFSITKGNCTIGNNTSTEGSNGSSAGEAPHGALTGIFLLCLLSVVNRLFA